MSVCWGVSFSSQFQKWSSNPSPSQSRNTARIMISFCVCVFYFFLFSLIRPKNAIQAVKKKLMSQNPHTAYYALLVLESIVKNCGSPIHDEISTKENCESFTHLIESTPHENVKTKMLELIQAWAFAFRTNDKYTAVKVRAF